MKFNGSLNVEVKGWTAGDCKVVMEREDNRAEMGILEGSQDFGEGSEYGKAAREEARRKKYGRQRKSYQHDKQPWRLTVNEGGGKDRKFRSIREGGAGEHADYWVFLKSGDDFLAHKIADWYQFLPCVTHRTLDIDQAEEQFQQRSRVMNQFALKAQIQKTLNTTEDDGEQLVKTSNLKIKDDYSSDDEDSDSGGQQGAEGNQKKKKKKNAREHNDKKQRVNHADEVAAYESEDGEDEGREYDYMSDSGSDSDRDTKTVDQKVEEALVGVGDESGLKGQLDGSDYNSSDEDEDTDEKKKTKTNEKEEEGEEEEERQKKRKKKTTAPTAADENSSGSESDEDPDKGLESVVFLQDNLPSSGSGGTSKKRALQDSSLDLSSKRPKVEEKDLKTNGSAISTENQGSQDTTTSVPSTQESVGTQDSTINDGLNEETVRKYLRRKPHTTKELLTRIKSKCPPEMSKAEIVTHLAAILKKIEPQQFKRKQGKKEVLFFSLANSAI